MAVDLSGVRAKFERALEHHAALEREITPAFEGECHQIKSSAEYHPHIDYYVFQVIELPVEWRMRVAVMLGDLVHSLRSALEQLAWQLVLNHSGHPKTRKQKTRIEFPIKLNRRNLDSTYTFSKVSSSDQAILDLAQPYNGSGNPKLHSLAILQQLSNRDKHRLLNPILLQSNTFQVWREDMTQIFFDVFSFEFLAGDKNLKVGTEIVVCKLVRNPDDEMKMTGYSAPKLCLPQRRDVSLIEGLDIMIRAVESTINEFAYTYQYSD